jgi:hypothetical protein
MRETEAKENPESERERRRDKSAEGKKETGNE